MNTELLHVPANPLSTCLLANLSPATLPLFKPSTVFRIPQCHVERLIADDLDLEIFSNREPNLSRASAPSIHDGVQDSPSADLSGRAFFSITVARRSFRWHGSSASLQRSGLRADTRPDIPWDLRSRLKFNSSTSLGFVVVRRS